MARKRKFNGETYEWKTSRKKKEDARKAASSYRRSERGFKGPKARVVKEKSPSMGTRYSVFVSKTKRKRSEKTWHGDKKRRG